jgi:hypothetical protein
MLKPMIEKSELRLVCDPARRGYNAVYRRDQTNHCPGCGRTHWYVGRISAECGFCGTALPFAELEYSASGIRRSWRQAAA